MKSLLPIAIILVLTGCNLAASLTGGTGTATYNPSYEFLGQTHTMSITFDVKDEVVTELTIKPEAVSMGEEAAQIAFAANVRAFVLGKNIQEIDIPKAVGDEERLREVFRKVVEELQQ